MQYVPAKLPRCNPCLSRPPTYVSVRCLQESVHFLSIPEFEEVDRGIMKAVRAMRTVVQLGRKCRERRTLNLKTPVSVSWRRGLVQASVC